jgi:DNA invertase Pin-like site-specific DNA recombinase
MAAKGKTQKAVAYLRTSSAANVGADKDSGKRQRASVEAFAKRAGIEVVEWFNDAAVSRSDLIEDRPGFAALLDRIETNGVRTVIVEDASRLARAVLVQELAIVSLKARDVRVLAANGDDLTETDDEMKNAMRQMAVVFAELEKRRLVKKLAAARARKRATGVKVEGRKSHAELNPELVREAKRLRRRSPKGHQRSLRDISAALSERGFVNANGRPFSPSSIKAMIEVRAI